MVVFEHMAQCPAIAIVRRHNDGADYRKSDLTATAITNTTLIKMLTCCNHRLHRYTNRFKKNLCNLWLRKPKTMRLILPTLLVVLCLVANVFTQTPDRQFIRTDAKLIALAHVRVIDG